MRGTENYFGLSYENCAFFITFAVMIDESTKNRILDTAQIVDVVSEFVQLRRRGVNYIGLCPFHNERTPSFNVNPARGIFKCFGCGKSGDAARFLMEHEQMTFPEALRWLANKYGIQIEEKEMTDEERQSQNKRESLFIINQFARDWFQHQLRDTDAGRSIGLAYFRKRGFRDDIIEKFQLGYSPDISDALAKEASAKGYKEENLVDAGVCIRSENDGHVFDRFRGRVMFPIHSLSGKVVGFSGRVLTKDAKAAKYVNTPQTEVYLKSEELYGIWLAKSAIVKNDKCFLVEGNTDVVSMHQAGVENVVASCGTSLTTGQIRKIHRFTNNITLIYDGDSAGIHASLRGIDMLLEEGMAVKVVLLPDGDDPDSFAQKHNATEFQQFIEDNEVDFIRFKTNLLLKDVGNDPFKRSNLIKDIVNSICVIPDELSRSTNISICSQLLQMDEKIIVNEVNNIRKAKREEKQRAREREQERQANISASNTGSDVPVEAPETKTAEADVTQPEEMSSLALHFNAQTQGSILYKKELLLMSEMVRHGEEVIDVVDDECGQKRPLTVAECIYYDMKNDDLSFSEPLMQRMTEELVQHVHEEGFEASRFFRNHADPAVSGLAIDLLTDKYELSQSFSAKSDSSSGKEEPGKSSSDELALKEVIPHLLNDYKMVFVEEEIKQVKSQLKSPELRNNPEQMQSVMENYNELLAIKRELAKQLGNRVIAS